MTVALPVAPDSMPKEPLVLPDVPALLPSSCRSIHDLLHPLPVAVLLCFDVRRQILAEHVRLHEAVARKHTETTNPSELSATGFPPLSVHSEAA